VDHAAGILLAEMAGDRAAHAERSVQMHGDDVQPVRPAHAMKDFVAQDAGVVHQDVDALERIERRLHDLVGILRLADRERRGDGLAARLLDLVDHLLRRAGVVARAVERRADVVDHDLGALLRQQHRDGTADATSRAGDDGHFSFNNTGHACFPCLHHSLCVTLRS
jgi:hypothetical protein